MNIIQPHIKFFDEYLKNNTFDKKPYNLYQPANYILSLGGKRLRPAFVLLACQLYGKYAESGINAAMAIEVFHNFTLLHDDIMDQAELRRGNPTVHKKYNTNTAILTGDMMLILAYDFILKYEEPELIKNLLAVFNKMSINVCEGQQMDMDFETNEDVTIDDYLSMITLKTSVLIGACFQMGGIIGHASQQDQIHLYEFGKNFGIAFQLQDDILDVFGKSTEVGKRIGGDILQNKKTYLYLKSLELADNKQSAMLRDLYSNSNNMDEDLKIKAVSGIYNSLLVKEYSNQLIEAYIDLAISHLNSCKIDPSTKNEIIAMVRELMLRTY